MSYVNVAGLVDPGLLAGPGFCTGLLSMNLGYPVLMKGQAGSVGGVGILPYMEQNNIYQLFNPLLPLTDAANKPFLRTQIQGYKCPSDPQPNFFAIVEEGGGAVLAELPSANYIGCFGPESLDDCELSPGNLPVMADGTCKGGGTFYHNSSVRIAWITDGTSHTFMVGERRTRADLDWHTSWPGMIAAGEEAFQRVCGSADHVPNDPLHHFDDFSSVHTGGAQFCLGDGSVRFISENMDKAVYWGLATIQGGEVSGDF